MNDVQRNRWLMVGKVVVFFETGGGSVLYPLALGLSAKETSLKNLYETLTAEDAAATQDDTGITQMTEVMRNTLTIAVRRVGNAALNYFRDNNMGDKKNRIRLLKNNLENANEADFCKNVFDVWVNADTVKTLLGPYNAVTAAEVTGISTQLAAYRLSAPKALEARSDREGHGIVVDGMFTSMQAYLEQIDELMELFRDDHVQLYTEYLGARGIDDYTGPGSSHNYDGTVPPAAELEIGNVTMDINQPVLLSVSTPGGSLTFKLRLSGGGAEIGAPITVVQGAPQNITLAAFALSIPADAKLVAENTSSSSVGYVVSIG